MPITYDQKRTPLTSFNGYYITFNFFYCLCYIFCFFILFESEPTSEPLKVSISNFHNSLYHHHLTHIVFTSITNTWQHAFCCYKSHFFSIFFFVLTSAFIDFFHPSFPFNQLQHHLYTYTFYHLPHAAYQPSHVSF